MRRIDFLGVPGAGKTTLFDEMLRQRTQKSNWLTLEEAKLKCARQKYPEALKSFKEFYKAFLLYSYLYKITTPNLPDIILKQQKDDLIWTRRNELSKFLEVSLNLIASSYKEPVLKFLDHMHFFRSIEDALLLDELDTDKFLAFDESLSKRPLFSSRFDADFKRIIYQYYENMPVPSLIIYCLCEPEEIFKRLIHRKNKKGHVAPDHRDLSDRELVRRTIYQRKIAEIAVGILIKRGVPILELNMKKSIQYNALKAIRYIDSMEINS